MSEHIFWGNQLEYARNGFTIIDPGQTVTGKYYCIGPISGPVILGSCISEWGGDLSNRTIRVSVFGSFTEITVSSSSTHSLIAYGY